MLFVGQPQFCTIVIYLSFLCQHGLSIIIPKDLASLVAKAASEGCVDQTVIKVAVLISYIWWMICHNFSATFRVFESLGMCCVEIFLKFVISGKLCLYFHLIKVSSFPHCIKVMTLDSEGHYLWPRGSRPLTLRVTMQTNQLSPSLIVYSNPSLWH